MSVRLIRMRRLARIALVAAPVLLTACGNWSNEDLLFLAALPDPAELESKLPGTRVEEAAQGLTSSEAQALLADSEGYRFTVGASTLFNQTLFAILDGVERAKGTPPTVREANARQWGPWRDWARDAWIRLRVSRECDAAGTSPGAADPAGGDPVEAPACRRYLWQVEMTRQRDGAWTPVISGAYDATGSLREGSGVVVWDVDAMRTLDLATPDLVELARLEMAYRTDPMPMWVYMKFVGTAQATFESPAEYAYLETETGAGALRFHLKADVGLGPSLEDLAIVSGWRAEGTGRAAMIVRGGDVPLGAVITECWDPDGERTWLDRSWDGLTEGDEALCPTGTPQFEDVVQ